MFLGEGRGRGCGMGTLARNELNNLDETSCARIHGIYAKKRQNVSSTLLSTGFLQSRIAMHRCSPSD